MSEAQKLYEGLYLVRVLSDQPQGKISGPDKLSALLQEAISGDCVADVLMSRENRIDAEMMQALLYNAGSSPKFFDLVTLEDHARRVIDSADATGCAGDCTVVDVREVNQMAAYLDATPSPSRNSKSRRRRISRGELREKLLAVISEITGSIDGRMGDEPEIAAANETLCKICDRLGQ